MTTEIRYTLEWEYEQKDGWYQAKGMNRASLGELLRFLVLDDESNRTYVRIFDAFAGSSPHARIALVNFRDLNNGRPYSCLVDGDKP